MAEEFLGLKISVLLHSGARIEGTFLSIEPFTRQLTLKDGTPFNVTFEKLVLLKLIYVE
jgi:hypothetical protein